MTYEQTLREWKKGRADVQALDRLVKSVWVSFDTKAALLSEKVKLQKAVEVLRQKALQHHGRPVGPQNEQGGVA